MTDIGEFDLIETYFAPLSKSFNGAFALTDDAAVLDVPEGRKLVVTTDMLVSGVHFIDDTSPACIAAKALRVNLSDLAAMAAEPFAYTLSLALPGHPDGNWLEAFTHALSTQQTLFNVSLIGGDTVSTPGPLSLSITAFGHIESGCELRRSGAKVGDLVFVSGSIGSAAMGLRVLRGEIEGLSAAEADTLIDRHYRPQPRIQLGRRLAGVAHAAIDVSDGLVQDLGHVCRQSGLGAVIEAARVPVAAAAEKAAGGRVDWILGGGDDYELLFTAPAENREAIMAVSRQTGVDITCIGHIEGAPGVHVVDNEGVDIPVADISGFRHF